MMVEKKVEKRVLLLLLNDGRKEGRKESATSIAKNLLNMNLSVKDVMKATGLKQKDIKLLM